MIFVLMNCFALEIRYIVVVFLDICELSFSREIIKNTYLFFFFENKQRHTT